MKERSQRVINSTSVIVTGIMLGGILLLPNFTAKIVTGVLGILILTRIYNKSKSPKKMERKKESRKRGKR